MAQQNSFNPAYLDANEQPPAKIWELIRRSKKFRAVLRVLLKLDDAEKKSRAATKRYHGGNWSKSVELIGEVERIHPFAAVALRWLVPEPLFIIREESHVRGKSVKVRTGEGTTPDFKDDSHWSWRDAGAPDVQGHPLRRGPVLHWTRSTIAGAGSKVNPLDEWQKYPWPFTTEHTWPNAPAQFRREFQFIWRHYDSRPVNPITNDRSDSPTPHEVVFFQECDLMGLLAAARRGNFSTRELYHVQRSKDLARGYRVFAIPKTILTKGAADAAGEWLAGELKKGSSVYGDLLKEKLFNDGELFGTAQEWADWLADESGRTGARVKDTHYYRRRKYMKLLVRLIYPRFEIAELLAPPEHRARSKKYIPKGGQK